MKNRVMLEQNNQLLMNVKIEHSFSTKEKVRTNIVDIEEKYVRLNLVMP